VSAYGDRPAYRLALIGVLLAGLGLTLVAMIGQGGSAAPAASSSVAQDDRGPRATVDEVAPDEPLQFSKQKDRAGRPAQRTRGYVASTPARSPKASGSAIGRPTQIVVPALSVRAPVVAIAAQGSTLVPPSDPTTIGWWSGGAHPGATTGTAVLTGHTVSTGGGAFDDLDLMSAGQQVRIGSGETQLDYVVRSVTIYPKQTLAEHAAELFDQTVPGRLALVTCEDWNGSVYLSNAVVIADPVV
jgi:LPXTG-site transpeptidase (sortase) family protein